MSSERSFIIGVYFSNFDMLCDNIITICWCISCVRSLSKETGSINDLPLPQKFARCYHGPENGFQYKEYALQVHSFTLIIEWIYDSFNMESSETVQQLITSHDNIIWSTANPGNHMI